ncbi:MAG: esterase-like activity of phytase family protein [Phycisphaerales bacterium]
MARAVGLASVLAFVAPASGQSFEVLDEFPIEGFARVNGLAFTGISGLDYDPQSQRWIAVSNDTGGADPVRFFGMRVEVAQGEVVRFDADQAQALNHPDGTVFEPGRHTPGAVRIIPADPIGDEPYLVWTSEGVLDQGQRAGVFEMCTGATFMDWFATEPYLSHAPEEHGPRVGRAFESVALMPDHSLIAGFEQALIQDGPPAVRGSGTTPVRLVHFDYWDASTKRELVYPLEEPPADAPEGAERSLVELIAVDQNTLLSIESIMVPNQPRSPRAETELYLVSLDGATDVRGVASLASSDASYTPVTKRKLADNESLGLRNARYNAGAFWHELEDGRHALLLVSDNANDTYRPTYFAVLAVEGLEPMRPYVKDAAGRHGAQPGPDAYEARVLGPFEPIRIGQR